MEFTNFTALTREDMEKRALEKYIMDFESVKEKLVYKLINTEKNRELLKDVPHVEFLDLSIVFQYIVSKDEEITVSILIHNAHMRLWKVSVEEVYRIARNNTQNLMGYEMLNMEDIVLEMMNMEKVCDLEDMGEMKELSHNTPMYVLTNKSRLFGAVCIIYPDLLKDFACAIKSGFYVIPSSVHEVILVPSEDTFEADEIRRMIKKINDTQVKPEEILSYSLYYFDKDKNKLLNL